MRDFPAVEELLQSSELQESLTLIPRPIATDIVRDCLERNKKRLQKDAKDIPMESLYREINSAILKFKRTEITPVINAAGIIVHTNLGRAPLAEELFDAVKKVVTGYGNIEFDLAGGKRGKRGVACEHYLAKLSGAEAATVVNNNAAALFIILNTLANRKKVLISRGELVQIGGGFKIPDILKRAGAKLSEVGTTNITTVADYEQGIDDGAGLILKVHKSNFIQAGFTEEASIQDLVKLGKKHDLPVINDLGSGVLIPTDDMLDYKEETVQQSVRAGADITSFSGDKMLGGCQAGLIVGRTELVQKIKKNPLFRSLRVDKIVFSILEKLLGIYLSGEPRREIGLWSVVSVPESELYLRAKKLLIDIGQPSSVSVESTVAYMGGGALPEAGLPSVGLVFSEQYKASRLMAAFREKNPPIIGRIDKERFVLDIKTVLPHQLEILTSSIKQVLNTMDQ